MPEIITKHPKTVKEVLESGGAKCGQGLEQEILKKCPRESFCSLPGGEICIYGVDEINQMTQIKPGELCPPVAGSAGWVVGATFLAMWVAQQLRRIRR